MLYEGASGDTKLEMLRLLSLPDNYQSNRERAGKILSSLKVCTSVYLFYYKDEITMLKSFQRI